MSSLSAGNGTEHRTHGVIALVLAFTLALVSMMAAVITIAPLAQARTSSTGGTPAVSFSAPVSGSMVGRVTNGYDGLAGVYVLYSDATVPKALGYTITDASGNFALSSLPPGQYRVGVIDGAWWANRNTGYLPEYWNTRSSVTFTDGPTYSVASAAATNLGSTTLAGHDCDPVAFAPGSVHHESLVGKFLPGCDLDTVDFARADLTGANLRGANLKNAYFNTSIIDRADLSGADLNYSLFIQTSAVGANVHATKATSFARLIGLQLVNADATNVEWNSLDISFTNFTGSNFAGASVTASTYSATTCPDGQPATILAGCAGHGIP